MSFGYGAYAGTTRVSVARVCGCGRVLSEAEVTALPAVTNKEHPDGWFTLDLAKSDDDPPQLTRVQWVNCPKCETSFLRKAR